MATAVLCDAGLLGNFEGLVIKDASTMIVTRAGDVPLRTTDGGATWKPMQSCAAVATLNKGLVWSWSGKTLVMIGSGGTQSAAHPHAPFVWMSKDDGDSWTDETGDLVTMAPGAANWSWEPAPCAPVPAHGWIIRF